MGATRIGKAILAILVLFFFSPRAFSEVASERQAVILSEAARHFGAEVAWKPAEGKLILTHGDSHAHVLIGSDRLLIDDYLLTLTAPIRIQEGAVYISTRDAAAIFSRLFGREVTEAEIIAAGFGELKGAVQGVYLDSVRHISYPDFTRFIIGFRGVASVEKVEVNCFEEGGDLVAVFPNARFSQREPPLAINDGTVNRVEFALAGEAPKLIVSTGGAKKRYEVQKYDSPPRIVLDVRVEKPAVATDFGQHALLPAPNDWDGPQPEPRRAQSVLTTVVIDPGHGGKDVGAHGRGGLYEKDVTLDIALRLKELLEKKPGMKVVLTRNGDHFVSLEERTVIANSAKEGAPADLFISIHTNSHKSSSVDGFEAYYISDAIDPGAEATAALENAVIKLERKGKEQTADALLPILWDLQFTEFISESSELAFIAQEKLGGRLSTRNRGVRQAKFIVLSGVAMPSILIEVGFISNHVEEAKMKTADFKDKCAEALAEAILNFKERRDVRLGLLGGKTKP